MLPELPKKNNKKEADFGLKFREWIEKGNFTTAAFELKHTRGKDYLNFSEVKEAQLRFARRIESRAGALIRTKGVRGMPDYIYMKSEPAFIIIKYPRFFAVISVYAFMCEKEMSKKKSLTSSRAVVIAAVCV